MKLKLIVSSILLTASLAAQPMQDSVIVRDFSGGLNTVSSDFAIDAKYGRMVHNFDLGKNVGALTRRLGYDSVTAIASASSDSIRAPYGVYLPDGRQFLVYFTDLKSLQYGEIQRSDINGTDISLGYTIARYWGMKYRTSYAMQNGVLFIANGQNRMLAYDALGGKFGRSYPNPFDGGPIAVDYARPIPPYAPGELEIYPLLDTAGASIIHGDYIWAAVIQDSGAALNRRVGYLTPRMRIDSGRAMIRGVQNFFVADTTDSTMATPRYIKLYRTKANPGPVTQFTTLFKTGDSVKFPGGAVTITDDTPDASLIVADSVMPSQFKTSDWLDPARPGQPQIKLRVADSAGTAAPEGMANGTKGLKIMKWAWACTFVDTSFNAESDTGAHLELDSTSILTLTTDSTRWARVDLFVPKPNSGYQHMGINIYRAPMYFSVLDTAIKDTMVWRNKDLGVLGEGDTLVHARDLKDGYLDVRGWRSVTARDTSIFGPFRKVGHLGPNDSIFVDTFSVSAWSKGDILRQNRPPSGINHLASYGGRIFGAGGSRLYLSLLDSGSFAQMRFIDINKDDGDEITGIFPTRRAVRVLKGASSYNVYQDDVGNWSRTEVSNGIGCIAPQSIAHSALGWYYLSDKGVVLENDGPYIERTQSTQLVSAPLKNLDLLSMAAKRNAVGICADNKYLLCIGDTTYVYDEKAQAWGTWSLKFSGATLYGVDANINFVRPDTMYFVQPNSRTLFRFGSARYDNGEDFEARWETPLMLLDGSQKCVDKFGLWTTKTDTADWVNVTLYNENGTSLTTQPLSNAVERYKVTSLPVNTVLGARLKLYISTVAQPAGVTVIDGFNLYYHRQGGVGE